MDALKVFVVFLVVFVGILSPVPVRSEQPQFQRTPSQKGIGVSTDVAVIALPVATLAGLIIEKDWVGLKQGALTAATTVSASLILKYAIKEERPDKSNFHSFPSGHTSVAFANAMFLQRRLGWKLGVPAYVVATYVGWGRVFAKKHHWWDVVVGAAIGAGSAIIYTRPFATRHELSISPTAMADGVGVNASFSF